METTPWHAKDRTFGTAQSVPLARGIDRRRRAGAWLKFERRSGFDRRREYPVTGRLRDDPHSLLAVLVAINALSALDFLFTSFQLNAGIATEANPILAPLFAGGAFGAWAFKTIVTLAVSLGIWLNRGKRQILMVAVGGLVVYLLVTLYHIVGMAAFAAY